jgi:hypothetical protein
MLLAETFKRIIDKSLNKTSIDKSFKKVIKSLINETF